MERTLVIVKPDAFEKGATGKIIDRFISEGFRIRALKLFRFTKEQAEGFYAVHRERPFFGELVEFMTSGPVVAMVLEGFNLVHYGAKEAFHRRRPIGLVKDNLLLGTFLITFKVGYYHRGVFHAIPIWQQKLHIHLWWYGHSLQSFC